MRRSPLVSTILALTLLASEPWAQSIRLKPYVGRVGIDGSALLDGASTPGAWFRPLVSAPIAPAIGTLTPSGVSQTSGSSGPAAIVPLKPVGAPTAWVSAKDLAGITLSPGGSGSRASSCVNRGSAGGTFSQPSIGNEPIWHDTGAFGAGRPYFSFPGQFQVWCFVGSLPSTAYITYDEFTIYIVMYATALESNSLGAGISHNATPIEFSDVALSVRSGGGGAAIGLNADGPAEQYDAVEAPISSGDLTLHVWKLVHSGGVLSLSVDGGTPLTVASGSTFNLNGAPIVGFNGQHFNTGVFYGVICEWIVYKTPLSPAQDAINLAYLRNQWGTP